VCNLDNAQCISNFCSNNGLCTASPLNSFTMTWNTRETNDGYSTQIVPTFVATTVQCAQICIITSKCVGFTMDFTNFSSYSVTTDNSNADCGIFSALKSRYSSKPEGVYMKK
jgi:hypothetical protein